jgi:hypothetical protein
VEAVEPGWDAQPEPSTALGIRGCAQMERQEPDSARPLATVPLPRPTRWTRWANRRMGFGDFDLWVPEEAIASAPLLVRAIRWHKQAPRTTESLTLGHRQRWEDSQPRDE